MMYAEFYGGPNCGVVGAYGKLPPVVYVPGYINNHTSDGKITDPTLITAMQGCYVPANRQNDSGRYVYEWMVKLHDADNS